MAFYSSQECTWGIAYRVHPSDVPEVMAYLDHREKGGYTTHEVTFHPMEDTVAPFTALVYIGTEANPSYLGPAPLGDIAEQVVKSRGHSGCNTEYVLELAKAMKIIAPLVHDEHLFTLEAKVREMLEVERKKSKKDVASIVSAELPMCKCCNCSSVKRTNVSLASEASK